MQQLAVAQHNIEPRVLRDPDYLHRLRHTGTRRGVPERASRNVIWATEWRAHQVPVGRNTSRQAVFEWTFGLDPPHNPPVRSATDPRGRAVIVRFTLTER